MIWVWLNAFVVWVRRMLVPPAVPPPRKIDINAPCPNCGHCQGSLSVGVNGGAPAVQHTCRICGAKFYENPVLTDTAPSKTGTTKIEAAAPALPAATPPATAKE